MQHVFTAAIALSGLGGTLIGYLVFGKPKIRLLNAQAREREIQGDIAAINMWKELVQELKDQVNILTLEVKELKTEIHQLRQENHQLKNPEIPTLPPIQSERAV